MHSVATAWCSVAPSWYSVAACIIFRNAVFAKRLKMVTQNVCLQLFIANSLKIHFLVAQYTIICLRRIRKNSPDASKAIFSTMFTVSNLHLLGNFPNILQVETSLLGRYRLQILIHFNMVYYLSDFLILRECQCQILILIFAKIEEMK